MVPHPRRNFPTYVNTVYVTQPTLLRCDHLQGTSLAALIIFLFPFFLFFCGYFCSEITFPYPHQIEITVETGYLPCGLNGDSVSLPLLRAFFLIFISRTVDAPALCTNDFSGALLARPEITQQGNKKKSSGCRAPGTVFQAHERKGHAAGSNRSLAVFQKDAMSDLSRVDCARCDLKAPRED